MAPLLFKINGIFTLKLAQMTISFAVLDLNLSSILFLLILNYIYNSLLKGQVWKKKSLEVAIGSDAKERMGSFIGHG